MRKLEEAGRIDLDVPAHRADPRCSTSYLQGPARGKMMGVLVARARSGTQVVLKAFSGQYNGLWQVKGWAGPLFDQDEFHRLHDPEEKRIKELGCRMEQVSAAEQKQLGLCRRERSRQLMQAIHGLYRVRNFRGREAGLGEIFAPGTGIPTGTGDCCAPRLLQQAVLHNLVPLGLAEFYWGRSNVSGTRVHGRFYGSCRAKCYPLLGFMLCGLEENR